MRTPGLSLSLAWLLLLPVTGRTAPELTTDPVNWFDADNKYIPEPVEIEENQVWGHRRPHLLSPGRQASGPGMVFLFRHEDGRLQLVRIDREE